MRYLIVDFKENTICWKDDLTDPNEGGSVAYANTREFAEDLTKEVKEALEEISEHLENM